MSERTEQLILMLTPEEKAMIERIAREWNQTPSEYIVDLVSENEAILHDEDADIEADLCEALRDVKAGRVKYFDSFHELINSPDGENE